MKVFYLFVLDQSGSMGEHTELTKTAIRNYIKALKETCPKNNVDGYVSLLAFDAQPFRFDYFYKLTPVLEADENCAEKYAPCGGTPLIDAVAKSILDLQDEVGSELGNEDVRVLVNVYSDGLENSSINFKPYQLRKMIECLSSSNWTFTFQCAGAEETIRGFAESISIAKENVLAYEASVEGYTSSYSSLVSSLSVYTSSVSNQKTVNNLFSK